MSYRTSIINRIIELEKTKKDLRNRTRPRGSSVQATRRRLNMLAEIRDYDWVIFTLRHWVKLTPEEYMITARRIRDERKPQHRKMYYKKPVRISTKRRASWQTFLAE